MGGALLVFGLVLLTGGADLLVRGASRLARQLGITPLVVGLTVVAMGTSAPEFAVSARAALAGQGDLALGNVVGSNIFNVLLILGLSAVIVPLSVSAQLVRLDVPVLVGVSLLTWAFAGDGLVGAVEGGVLLAGLALYTALLVVLGKRHPEAPGGNPATTAPKGPSGVPAAVLLLVVGLGLLVLGAQWFVDGAGSVARWLGVGELAIGLTVVAAGTSAPEAATSIVAALRGERDIAVGNVVGSNTFNLLGVLGASSVVSAGGVPVADVVRRFDLPVMVGVAFLCVPVFFTGGRISRFEGLLGLVGFVAYQVVVLTGAGGR
jgi:cation:H+ antiporter